jgi:hypothetical protein
MTRPRARIIAVLAAGLSLTVAAHSAAQRSGKDRALYVSVTDQSGAPVPDLGPADIIVREDNLAREVLRVQPAEDPMQIAVLVDTSDAARDHIAHIRQALPPFVAALTKPNAAGRRNELAIIGIGERPTILAEYSSDPIQIKKGVDRIWALQSSGMYLLDAIVESSKGLRTRSAQRPVIVAIATSGQEFSNLHHDLAIEPLKSNAVAFYVLSLGQPDVSLSTESRERAIVLDEGTRVSGGYQEQLLSSMALTTKLNQLANQLTHQYKVTYSRPESLIPPEKITVAAAKPGLVARGTPVKEDRP